MLRIQLHGKDKIINTLDEKIQNDNKTANQNKLQKEIEKLTSQLASVKIAKVIAVVLRFSNDQTDQIIKKKTKSGIKFSLKIIQTIVTILNNQSVNYFKFRFLNNLLICKYII